MTCRLRAERERHSLQERAERLADALHGPLASLAAESTRRLLAEQDVFFAGAYLVRREQAETFKARVAELAAAHPGVRLLCTGPWPPYHFTPQLDATEAPRA